MKNKTYLIAEIGSNHDGVLKKALKMVEDSKKAGADAVKFQTFQVDKLLNPLVFHGDKVEDNWVYHEMKKVEIGEDFHRAISEKCQEMELDFISSPFDEQALDMVSKYCSRIKIASSEVTNIPFLKQIGKYKKPVILSTGMAFLGEVEEAISALIQGGATDLSLLHCVSLYPLKSEDANLEVIRTLKQAFGLKTGFSDHSLSDTLVLGAVSLGAEIIEKHVTEKRENRIFDHPHSMEFSDFREMVEKIRSLEQALGDGIKKIRADEMTIREGSHRSFFASQPLKAGDIITEKNTKAVRPFMGIPAKHKTEILGKKVNKDISENYPIFWEDIEW
jgi:N-acetylneuraminate synthase/N,N'-diacetyllegionaminate synthase